MMAPHFFEVESKLHKPDENTFMFLPDSPKYTFFYN